MINAFGSITQPHISKILSKQYKSVSIINVYETRKNPKKVFKFLSSVIYTIIRNYVCIYYLASESKKIKWTVSWLWWGLQTWRKKLWQNIGDWNSRSVNEFDVLS